MDGESPDQTIVRGTVGMFLQMFIVIDAAVRALAVGWASGLIVLSS